LLFFTLKFRLQKWQSQINATTKNIYLAKNITIFIFCSIIFKVNNFSTAAIPLSTLSQRPSGTGGQTRPRRAASWASCVGFGGRGGPCVRGAAFALEGPGLKELRIMGSKLAFFTHFCMFLVIYNIFEFVV
jgi:hypothetical protein